MSDLTHGKLHDQIAYSVMRSRLDIDGYRVTYGCLPPGMFTNLLALEEWIFDMEFRSKGVTIVPKKLDNFPEDDVIILSTQTGAPVCYEAVWVRASWKQYRKAMKAHLKRDAPGLDGIATLDADHVINKARVVKNHPDGWVMLMPVPASSNRAFGSAIEKGLPPIAAGRDLVLIEPVLLLKTFAGTGIQNLTDLDALEIEIKGQMLHDKRLDAVIETALQEYKTIRGWQAK